MKFFSWKKYFILFIAVSSCAANANKLPTQVITLGDRKITVEVASSPKQRAQGLMHRKSIPKDSGMLFIFDRPEMLKFWMKNTYIPLTVGYFDAKGILFELFEMEPVGSSGGNIKSYFSSRPAKFALEMNRGWFKKHKVKIGEKLKVIGSRPGL